MRAFTKAYEVIRCSVSLFVLIFSAGAFADTTKKAQVPFFDEGSFSPKFALDERKEFSYVTLKNFVAKDQLNNKFDVNQLKSKITVLNFFFTSCGGICPLLMTKINSFKKKMSQSQSLNSNVQFVSISVTPDIDTPLQMTSFANMQKLNLSNWLLVAGNKKETEKLALETFRSGVQSSSKKLKHNHIPDFVHSESLFLLDKNLRLRGIYNGKNSVEYELLLEDLLHLEFEK